MEKSIVYATCVLHLYFHFYANEEKTHKDNNSPGKSETTTSAVRFFNSLLLFHDYNRARARTVKLFSFRNSFYLFYNYNLVCFFIDLHNLKFF